MTEPTIWWVLAGCFVAIELITGTLYLLLISLGMAAAAISAQVGAPTSVQIAVAAVVGGGSAVIWRSYKNARPAPPSTTGLNLDIGEMVHVEHWEPNGTGSVKYRGASWHVALMPGDPPLTGTYRIAEITGNRLIVKKV